MNSPSIKKYSRYLSGKLLKISFLLRSLVFSKHISISVPELFCQHIGGGVFERYDMIVRLLAVEDYYGRNNIGFSMYRRMQEARKGKAWVETAEKRFRTLIDSYETAGYHDNSEIELDNTLHLIDGSHRMALALYYHQDYINVIVRPNNHEVHCYDIRWFRINGFSADECALLEAKFLELKKQMIVPFVCTLWHPARDYFEEITDHLSLFGKIVEIKDLHLSKWDYPFYTRGIYAVDDIEKWKIEKKLEYMTAEKSEAYELRMVSLDIDNPEFRLKKSNNKILSKKGELVKKLIRDAYKTKIDNYFHDIILHIGDNFYQNRHIYRLFTMPSIDVKTILGNIREYKYVITKIDVPYMPKDFPEHYPLGKDVDIICADEREYARIIESVIKDVQVYEDYYNIRIVRKRDKIGNEYRSLLRLEQEGQFLAFLFDISYRTGRLTNAFTQEMTNNRCEVNGIYVPQLKYEVIIRLDEYHNNMSKKHHIDYVKAHRDAVDKELADKYLHFNWQKMLS